uniref:RIIa domain-containing protein n=1 Tax=Megaselia scalaris TaxID=36166 RepID=T1GE38_MEGSC
MEEEIEILRACESYMQSNNIQALLKDVIAQLCLRQPRNPIIFLRQYFQKLERSFEILSTWVEDFRILGKKFRFPINISFEIYIFRNLQKSQQMVHKSLKTIVSG